MEGAGGMPHERNLEEANPLKSSLKELLSNSSSLKERGSVCVQKWEGGQCRDENVPPAT